MKLNWFLKTVVLGVAALSSTPAFAADWKKMDAFHFVPTSMSDVVPKLNLNPAKCEYRLRLTINNTFYNQIDHKYFYPSTVWHNTSGVTLGDLTFPANDNALLPPYLVKEMESYTATAYNRILADAGGRLWHPVLHLSDNSPRLSLRVEVQGLIYASTGFDMKKTNFELQERCSAPGYPVPIDSISATSTSVYSAGDSPSAAVDNNMATSFRSGLAAGTEVITLNLNGRFTLTKLELNWAAAAPKGSILSVYVSNDGVTYRTVQSGLAGAVGRVSLGNEVATHVKISVKRPYSGYVIAFNEISVEGVE